MKKTILTPLTLIIALAFLAACTAAPAAITQQPTEPAAATQAVPNGVTAPAPQSAVAVEQAYMQVYTEANPSVVNIQVIQDVSNTQSQGLTLPGLPQLQNPQTTPSQVEGSGFVYDSNGHIVTNNHVIENAANIVVTFADGSQSSAKLVGTDPGADLAVIQVQGDFSQLKPLALADFSTVKVGEIAVAIGNPFGLQGSMSTGIVSGLGRMLQTGSDQTQSQTQSSTPNFSIPDMIQTDTAINPGNSGGPLLNLTGQVIGVNTAIATTSGTNSGVGYAIPSSIVREIADLLIKNGKVDHAWLGIAGGDLTSNLATAMKLDAGQRGVLISEVVQGGPAEKAGLKGSSTNVTIYGIDVTVGGDIITAVDKVPVKTFDDLLSYIFLHTQSGQKVELSILRDGKPMTVTVTLESRPAS
ncbi:MAG: trypsin-like peptidase domain-containing protein [Anaerolineaceae bacterium]